MDKTVAGVLTAVTALALTRAHPAEAQAAAPASYAAALAASSYADLLRPIPNASALLAKAPVEAVADVSDGQPESPPHHHHHHHHHDHARVPPPPPPPAPHHHHHHHHHNWQTL